MTRIQKITALSLLAFFLCALTAWAYIPHSVKYRLKFTGSRAALQELHTKDQYCYGHYARLVNSKNKTVYNWGIMIHDKPQKIVYSTIKGENASTSIWNYKFDMSRLAPGKYTFKTHCAYYNSSYTFNYIGKPYLRFRSTKAIRQNDGDVVQRFYLSRNRLNNKFINVQIYNSQNKLVYSMKRKSNNTMQDFTFNWNGWPRGNSATKCPRGTYTLKYWADGINPKTVKFRLAI